MTTQSVTAPPDSGPARKLETVTRIAPAKGWTALNLGELWAYRGLLYQMTTRDIRARYKQSLLGKVWAVLQPLMMMIIYYTIFGLVLRLKTGTVPFPLFLLAGILIWQLIGGTATVMSFGLTGNAHLLNKIYFPRLLLPLSQSLSGLVDFSFGLVVLLVFMVLAGVYPTWLVLASPVFVLLAVINGLAFGLWFGPINVRYRDVGQVVPVMLLLLMYLSPVFYSPDFVPQRWQPLYYLNPAAGIIQGFRWTLMGDTAPLPSAAWGLAVMVLLFVTGLFYFRREEAELADNL